jgi:copper chaperone NosL
LIKEADNLKRAFFITLVLTMLIASIATAARKGPVNPTAGAKCPVCGMFVAKYKDWTGEIIFKNSSIIFFDGPKDMFRFYLNPGKYGSSRKQGDIVAVYVKDYYSLDYIDGRRASYVIGSDVLGPMGKELVPFAKKDEAEGFLKDHGGKRVLSFGEINTAILKSLD